MKSALHRDVKVQQRRREEENPYIIANAPTIAERPVATLVSLRDSKWTVRDLSPQMRRRKSNKPDIKTSTPKHDDTTDENGYEVPINFQRPIYMDFEPPKAAEPPQYKSNSLPKSSIHDRIKMFATTNPRQSVDDNSKPSKEQTIHHTNSQPCIRTSNLKPNDSFLAKCLRERPIRQWSSPSAAAVKAAQQDRRLPCSPPFLSLSLPVFWEGNQEESYHYEEIIPAFPHRKSLADHDYVEIRDSQEKYLLQSIKDQADVASSRSSSSSHSSDVENMWEKVAVPGVLRVRVKH